MDREERLENFKRFISSGNELTINDMLAIIVGCMAEGKCDSLHDILFEKHKAYIVDIKAKGVS